MTGTIIDQSIDQIINTAAARFLDLPVVDPTWFADTTDTGCLADARDTLCRALIAHGFAFEWDLGSHHHIIRSSTGQQLRTQLLGTAYSPRDYEAIAGRYAEYLSR